MAKRAEKPKLDDLKVIYQEESNPQAFEAALAWLAKDFRQRAELIRELAEKQQK